MGQGKYAEPISVTKGRPGLLCILLDQSGSMADKFGSGDGAKCEAVARAVNRAIEYVVNDCMRRSDVKDYLHVAIIGYGAGVQELLKGGSGGAGLPTISEVHKQVRYDTVAQPGANGEARAVQKPKWFDAKAENGTPMAEAFRLALDRVRAWVAAYPDSFPPVVLNITDGQPNDRAGAETAAAELRRVATTDGETLLFSCHISETHSDPALFPTEEKGLPDEYAKWLFQMSDVVPETLAGLGRKRGLKMDSGCRGFAFNADAASLVTFLNVGTGLTQLCDK